MGFQAIHGFHDMVNRLLPVRAMSAYLEHLLPQGDGPERLRKQREEDSRKPQSLVAFTAGAMRELGLGIVMVFAPEDPFGEAHVHVMRKQEGGGKLSKPLRQRIAATAEVLLP